ncbi:hypothetical protein MMC09_001947 [Bachmanniomyces sp. S44760]|nr:hypothetical protein [Bachmanniomyces sp. S44760]
MVMANQPQQGDRETSRPTKRLRWASQRITGSKAHSKRSSVLSRFYKTHNTGEKKRDSAGSESADGSHDFPNGSVQEENEDGDASNRSIYFNIPLPDDAKDDEGRPIANYGRNKIRTAKYTPMTFIPKNLWYQFHNIANIYFLFIIILQIFPIFGGANPGLSAVPLIFILFVTAVKDGIEDYKRADLDDELNNSPVHRLVNWNNVNVSDDEVSMWRKIKKACTRGMKWLSLKIGAKKKSKLDDGKHFAERALDGTGHSVDTRRSRRSSVATSRVTSFHSVQTRPEEDDIQLTSVPSPQPVTQEGLEESNSGLSGRTEFPLVKRGSASLPVRFYGSLIDPVKQAPEKARFKKDLWKNVRVGDFVRIYNDDEIPADVVILSTSDPDGACYVETKNLDGETNLKVRQALHSGRKVKHARDCEKTDFWVESEPPHANLYQFSGVARWKQRDEHKPEAPGTDMSESISINNLLLRGCRLRNTEWILGIVLFTGDETKIMINSGVTPSKRSRISRELNWDIIYNFIILLAMCVVSGTVQGVTASRSDTSLQFFEFGLIGGTPSLDGFITFWTGVVLFQNLVPISLYISLEIIKTIQAIFIYSDILMYYAKIDYPCTPKSWNISDDVGQIEYIFSDKTGTLTQNVMEFKKCTINGISYGEAYTEAQAGMQKRDGVNIDEEGAKMNRQIAEDRVKMLEDLRRTHTNPYLLDDDLTFVAPAFVHDLGGTSGDAQKKANENFMLALALCHSVITERTPGDPPKIEFKAQSPDEAALVATARDCGFTVLGRSNDSIILNVLGKEQEYEVLSVLEFNSSRKRMSTVIRMPNGRIVLFCKGADSVIYSRLRRGEQSQMRKATAEDLELFAREGLRTLCIAQRELGEEEYQTWHRDHEVAASAVVEREEKIEKVADAIERDLTLLGGTAIEDRLQDGVPDTIALLGDAGIKLWVLTGDKVETAINIGFSCNLLNNDMDLIVFKSENDTVESAELELDKHLASLHITGSEAELRAARKNHEPPEPTHAIVIDGDSLKLVLDDQLRRKFLLLCKKCKSVLCCRVSPSQKAAVVQMVKTGLDVMTLSVGDGANDVAMIQEADVGVGIAGEEGRQAVMSSDYAIGQFRFLQRLILVHGRWSYLRLSETIPNFFYKNIVWTFALFWYNIYNNFDSSYLFDYTYVLFYNLFFTSLPIIFMGILDQDVSDKVSLAVPGLYRRGIERKEWTQIKFWTYMFDALFQSLICWFMVYLLFAPANFVTSNGLSVNDRERMGVYVACATIVVVNLYVLLNTYRWDWLMLLLVAISIVLIWFWTGIYTAFTASGKTSNSNFYKAAPEVFGSLSFWTVSLLTVIICLTPRFAAKAFQKIFMPRDIDIIREQVRQGKFKYLDVETTDSSSNLSSATSSESSKSKSRNQRTNGLTHDEDSLRPIYPPSESQTATTHNPRSQNGSDGTEYTGHRVSLDRMLRQSTDRPRPSFDRPRLSMDRVRPSYEASNDFTSAALLTRIESSQSQHKSRLFSHGTSPLK